MTRQPGCAVLRGLRSKHVIDGVGKIVDARHWHDNDVAMPLAVLGDAEESAARFSRRSIEKSFLSICNSLDSMMLSMVDGADVRPVPKAKGRKNFGL